MTTELLTWIAILFCISQSAMFSGLNLAFFSLSRLRLEVEASAGNANAARVLALRRNPNGVLTTVLLGNVAINVLLTMLTDSLMTGIAAFLFSTCVITAFGEILPQAYFSRNALRVTSLLAPVFKLYQLLLYPIAGPIARLLDLWLGQEGLVYLREKEMRQLIARHIEAQEAEIDRIEGLGALNFLAIDDLKVVQEGEPLNPDSVVPLEFSGDAPVFPNYEPSRSDPFLMCVQASGEKWVVFVDTRQEPRLVIDADAFLRDALFTETPVDPMQYCHRPIVVRDAQKKLGSVLSRWRVQPDYSGDDVIDKDIVLLWGEMRRVITGADVLGRLLKGIAVVGAN